MMAGVPLLEYSSRTISAARFDSALSGRNSSESFEVESESVGVSEMTAPPITSQRTRTIHFPRGEPEKSVIRLSSIQPPLMQAAHASLPCADSSVRARSEERRVGKEWRSRWSPYE